MSDAIGLGPCCICERVGNAVRNIMMLDVRCLVPGHGWGCVVCHLPSDGASAVLCDRCLRKYRSGTPLRFACRGYPADEGRAPLAEFSEPFAHDERWHENL